ncbi:MAG TPA: TMEM165/GDT1 family protein [Thermoplasmata archaeon]|nr:TMEM165/GDT1 family protein [Thermoplasmata archaeon]
MFEDIIIPFVTIALAELGDKTQVSILLLSSRTKKYGYIFLGVFFAFLIVDGIAIALGNLITSSGDVTGLKPISGVVFIVFGVYMLLSKKEETEEKNYDKNIIASAFLMIFLTEWGDKTQVAAALFATQYNALFVLLGTMLALSLLSLMAIFFGKILNKRLNQKLLKKVAGVVFIILGITCFIF